MAPALGKRPREVGVHTTGNACVHGVGWRGYLCKECPGKGICEHGRQRYRCKECREARAASARGIRPSFRLKPEAKKVEPEIKREPSDTSDPGVDPDAEVASNVKPEPAETPDPGIVEP